MPKSMDWNRQALLEAAVCGTSSVLLVYLLVSGRYEQYLAARMAPYLLFAAVVLAGWTAAAVPRFRRRRHRQRTLHGLVLAVPIVLLLWPHKPLSATELSGRFLDRAAVFETTPKAAQTPTTPSTPGTQGPPGAGETPNITIDPSRAADTFDRRGMDEEARTIEIADDDFANWMNILFRDPSPYEGYSVTMTGFVFKDPEGFGPDGFVPARLMMTCCVADLVPAGMVVRYEQTPGLPDGAWYTVTGTLTVQSMEIAGVEHTVPELAVTAIEPADPIEGYIVP